MKMFTEKNGLNVILSLNENGVDHLSVSHRNRLPKWEELTYLREKYLDEKKVYVQMLPTKESYINIHSHCLHLWELNETLLKRYNKEETK